MPLDQAIFAFFAIIVFVIALLIFADFVLLK